MVLVQALEQPKIIKQGKIGDGQSENLVDQSFDYVVPKNIERTGVQATLNGRTIYINPERKDIKVYVKDGWKFKEIDVIRSMEEWEKFEKTISNLDYDDDKWVGLSYFFKDAGWLD